MPNGQVARTEKRVQHRMSVERNADDYAISG
jgi:hypothetical protein